MNDGEHDDWQESIGDYYSEIDYIREMLDPKKRLLESAVLVEKIIKTHFLRSDRGKHGLGTLLRMRRQFLGRQLFDNADFAVEMRNRVSHHTRRRNPTDEELEKATRVFLEVVRKHVEEMESRSGSTRSSTNAPQIPEPERTSKSSSLRFETNSSDESKPKTYATEIERESRPLLEAADDDPEVTASTIAEYTFCPRAGILTHEGGFSDPEEELPSSALLPWYKREAIEEAYIHAVYTLFAMPVGLVVTFVIVTLMMRGHALYFPAVLLLVAIWLFFAVKAFWNWRDIGHRRLAALLATECNPVPGKNAFQPVDWWGLLLAGYEVRRLEDPLKDERWKLSGKPRRILDKGTMSIPVHRIRKPEGPILPQHIVRVMAHCHLIERTEGADSPFAVILFGNTYQGMTVPNTAENRARFYTALERARAAIIASDNGERQPPEPITGNACSACHFGHPRPVALEDKTMRYGEPLDPVLLHNGSKVFHCDCGDRFHWKPKHERTRKMRKLE